MLIAIHLRPITPQTRLETALPELTQIIAAQTNLANEVVRVTTPQK